MALGCPQRGDRGSLALSLDQIATRHRRSLSNALLIGGSHSQRLGLAHALHHQSLLRLGSFITIDCATEPVALRGALEARLSGVDMSAGARSLIAVQHGTLFLDSVESLALESQRLLLALAACPPGERGRNESTPSVGRLICGASRLIRRSCMEGRFLLELYDALDKIRIDLDHSIEGAA